jgi:hypothetical protein
VQKGTGLGDEKVDSIIDKARNILSSFAPSFDNLAKIIKTRESGKLDEVFDFIDLRHSCFTFVIGEGLPVRFIYHDWGGMTRFILEVYQSIRKSNSEAQAAAARNIVEVYEKHMGLLCSKAPIMIDILKPLDGAYTHQGLERELMPDELQLLIDHHHVRSENYRTVRDYMRTVESSYGEKIRNLVLRNMTSEELEAYRLEMTDALENFISTDV